MELQKATIAMLGEAIVKNDKAVVQIANLLQTVLEFIFCRCLRLLSREYLSSFIL